MYEHQQDLFFLYLFLFFASTKRQSFWIRICPDFNAWPFTTFTTSLHLRALQPSTYAPDILLSGLAASVHARWALERLTFVP